MISAVKKRSPLKNISHRAIALATAMNLVDVGFLVVRGDTNLNNERRTNNHSYI
ncbi:hypothetical protein H6G97_03370 [Nostoc flagelliforme FACHB-838]|uniref:Transposase n=1 Tax=Nostoc flagelliforme FACHB-838 TaxID=2692904 RepID=A0ABR8DIG4_9NOSO|nr:hypothetical protein [Nostoc flagelliforme FACHB-838]